MGGFSIDASGFEASIDRLIEAVVQATRIGTARGAALIEANAKASFGPVHAKGTPKTDSRRPQSVSGTLKRSIIMLGGVSQIGQGTFTARVAPTTVYGRRIELGFAGTDSLGRHFPGVNPPGPGDPPYPYLKPGVDKSLPLLNPIFEAAWNAALQG